MLKFWLALLLLLNAALLAWQHDAFARWGWGPNLDREPERLLQQIKPEALRIQLPGSAEAQAMTPDTAATNSQPTETTALDPLAPVAAPSVSATSAPLTNASTASPATQTSAPVATAPAPAPTPSPAVPTTTTVPIAPTHSFGAKP